MSVRRRALLIVLALVAPQLATAQTIDFDGMQPGTVVGTIAPVNFDHSVPGIDLVVSTGLPTTSVPSYLGAADLNGPIGDDQDLFLPGEVLDLDLLVPANAITVAVISTPGTPPQAFELTTQLGSVVSDGQPDLLVGDDEVELLTFSTSGYITSAQLRSNDANGLFAWHVDDVFVPEPGLDASLAIGALLLVAGASSRTRLRMRAGSDAGSR